MNYTREQNKCHVKGVNERQMEVKEPMLAAKRDANLTNLHKTFFAARD